MGCRLLSGSEGVCFFDSVTMTAFGPVMESEEEAELLSQSLSDDPRRYSVEELHAALDNLRMEQDKLL